MRKVSSQWQAMFPASGLLRLFTSFPNCSGSLVSCFTLLLQASSWALDLRRPSQHSASHLSDRCLPPKQWIITAPHLSGCTHLVWSAAFLLLFVVIAWLPQSAYQAPFLGMARRCFVSVWLYLFGFFFSHPTFSSSFSSSFSLTLSFLSPSPRVCLVDPDTPIKWTSRLCERKEKKRENKKKDVLPPGE